MRLIDGWLKPADAKRKIPNTHTFALERTTPPNFSTIPTVSVLIRKIAHRKFIASVRYDAQTPEKVEYTIMYRNEVPARKGTWLHSEERESCTACQGRTALKLLEQKLRVLNAVVPKWNIVLQDETQNVKAVHLNETELQAIEQETEEPMQQELPALAPTSSGWCTPETDLNEWIAAYESAARMVWPGLEPANLSKLAPEASKQFRQSVIADMRSVGKISPWDTNAEGVPWHFIAKVQDPTSYGARAGDGDRRIRVDINGLKRFSNGDLVQPRGQRQPRDQETAGDKPAVGSLKRFGSFGAPSKALVQEQTVQETIASPQAMKGVAQQLRRFSNTTTQTTKATTTQPSAEVQTQPAQQPEVQEVQEVQAQPAVQSKAEYKYLFGTDEQRKLAFGRGRALKEQAKTAGLAADASKFYMIGVVVTLRSMGLPSHIEFEKALQEMGVSEEYLKAQSQQKAA
jgi:hypothetical protein